MPRRSAGAKVRERLACAAWPTQHSVVDVLSDHLQVVWGALVAFVVVVLLTPAVGGMARMLGVVDAPGGGA